MTASKPVKIDADCYFAVWKNYHC